MCICDNLEELSERVYWGVQAVFGIFYVCSYVDIDEAKPKAGRLT